MKKKNKHILFLILCICIILLYVNSKSNDICTKDSCDNKDIGFKKGNMHVAVVACGDRLEETLIMIKSAALFSRSHFTVHIFADSNLHDPFTNELSTWPKEYMNKFSFKVYNIQFPLKENSEEWRKLFKECASQRLFIPDILSDLNYMLYVDTDILFLRPLDDIWAFFNQFNLSQIVAMSPEHEVASAGWYNRFARHPYVPPLGVNSGVMLMNMKRMRNNRWLDHIVGYFKKHRYDITWGDQDLINIYFHYFPEQLYQYPCCWNYRPDHCMYSSTCKNAENYGVSILHGNRGVFHNDKQLVFKAFYDAFKQYTFLTDKNNLLTFLDKQLGPHINSNCGKVSQILSKQLRISISKY